MRKDAPDTIDGYVQDFPKDVQQLLKKMCVTIKKAAPQATEKMSYGIPTFALEGNLVHFGAFKSHIGFFPGAAGVASFQKDLTQYKTSKSAIQFPFEKPLPIALITRIVKFRAKQNLLKAKKKASQKSALK